MRFLIAAALALWAGPAAAAPTDCHSNLMIVLDRSCSMNMPPKAGGAQTKWQLAGLALQKVTTKYQGQLDFGLIMFPDQTANDCLQDGPIYVNVGPGNESQVVNQVMSTMPTGPCVTNIKPAFDQVSTDPQLKTPYAGTGPRSFVLFISDGKQTCGGNDTMIAASVKKLYDAGYPTYIVGFGGQVDPAALDQFATAGGVARKTTGGDAGGHLYYQADDAQTLDDALDHIVGAVAAEFTVCPGVPCPDGRCYAAGATCESGFCSLPPTDDAGGIPDGASGNSDGGKGTTGNGASSDGCGCQLGGAPRTGWFTLFVGLAALAIARRRRRRS